MKKTLLTIMTTVCVMGALFGGIISNMNAKHEQQIEELTSKYSAISGRLANENIDLTAELNNLEYQVQRMMTGGTYEISLKYEDGTTHTWKSDNVQ